MLDLIPSQNLLYAKLVDSLLVFSGFPGSASIQNVNRANYEPPTALQ